MNNKTALQLLVGIVGSLILLLHYVGVHVDAWVAFGIATVVQFWVGLNFIKSMLRDIRRRRAGMFTLISSGTLVAYIYSVAVLVFPDFFSIANTEVYTYFDEVVIVITLVLIGQILENNAKSQTKTAIESLMSLQVDTALVKVGSNWQETNLDLIQIGDIVLVLPGEKVPIDGVVVLGSSHVDESMITGESKVVRKEVGLKVIGATINQGGTLEVRVAKIGSETMLAQIISMVEKAQSTRPRVQKIVNIVSGKVVPAVLASALITFLLWYNLGPQPQLANGLMHLVAVLVVACPCALGLAVPTSIIVAVGKAAKNGILVRDAQVLEDASKINYVVFDKTGTLTTNQKEVEGFNWSSNLLNFDKAELKKYLAALEGRSTHPVAKALLSFLAIKENDTKVTAFESVTGLGVQGQIDGRTCLVGSLKFLEQSGIVVATDLKKIADQLFRQGRSVSLFSIDGHALAVWGITGQIRADAAAAIASLQKQGVQVAIMSGDNKLVTEQVGKKLGVYFVFAELLPEQKYDLIRKLRSDGYKVAMVGDGINDAPALALAHVGIAMGMGTDIAIESAGAVLLQERLALVGSLIYLSRRTVRNIYQNLAWAFAYNLLLVPIAAGVLYPIWGFNLRPEFACIAMALSSISVIVNALRLKLVKI
jgi:Cu+-exporting ATPase